MKTNIDYIAQSNGWNVLEVVYKSGFRRYIGLGDRYYMTTRTQDEFMKNSVRIETQYRTYWVDKDNPNNDIISRQKVYYRGHWIYPHNKHFTVDYMGDEYFFNAIDEANAFIDEVEDNRK